MSQKALQSAQRGARLLVADEIRRQARLLRRCRADHHDRLAHRRMLLQHGFDLPQFQTAAAYLDLGVEATVIFQGPIWEIARQITGFVEPGSGLRTEGMRDELGGGELWMMPIATRYPCPADVEFAQAPQLVRAADGGQAHRPVHWQ